MTIQFLYSISSPAGWSHQAGEIVDFADEDLAERFVNAGIAVGAGELQTSAIVAEPAVAAVAETSENKRYAINRVRLERGRAAWSWVVVKCSVCGGRHFHGGGPLGGDARELLGHKAAHCLGLVPSHPGYLLVDECPAHSACLLGPVKDGQR